MHGILRFGAVAQLIATASLLLTCAAAQQSAPAAPQKGNWDIGIWIAGATGEETKNSFTQTQAWAASVFLGKTLTGELGSGWRRGSLEYGFDLATVFVQRRPEPAYGGGFDPVVLRWNSAFHHRRVQPYIELSGGGILTNTNLPPGNTSSFNFAVRGGGGIRLLAGGRRSLDIGAAYYHISNANLGVQNPEFNGVQITVGYHWFK